MAKHQMRVDLTGAPAFITKQVYGDLKYQKPIMKAVRKVFDGHAHEVELFHWLNTDENGKYLQKTLTTGTSKGEVAPLVSMQVLRQHLKVMVELGQLKKLGERSPIYATPEYEAPEADETDEDESGDEAETDSDEADEDE